jgi:hypothetical protein
VAALARDAAVASASRARWLVRATHGGGGRHGGWWRREFLASACHTALIRCLVLKISFTAGGCAARLRGGSRWWMPMFATARRLLLFYLPPALAPLSRVLARLPSPVDGEKQENLFPPFVSPVRCIYLYIVISPYVRGFPAYLHLYLYYILWPLAPR